MYYWKYICTNKSIVDDTNNCKEFIETEVIEDKFCLECFNLTEEGMWLVEFNKTVPINLNIFIDFFYDKRLFHNTKNSIK